MFLRFISKNYVTYNITFLKYNINYYRNRFLKSINKKYRLFLNAIIKSNNSFFNNRKFYRLLF